MPEAPQFFVGARLRQAREAFGLSVESLADMLGITRQAVDQFERGKQPSEEHIIRLCSILNKPVSYFSRPLVAKYNDQTIFFRKLKKAPAVEIKSAKATTEWVGDIVALLDEEVDFPSVNLPRNLVRHQNPLLITNLEIEKAAKSLRDLWGLADLPISNLTGIMEDNGIIVTRMNFHSHDVDGLSIWDADVDRPIVILNADKASAVRSRFDAAHELGHLVLHRWISSEDLKAYDKELEKQAHYFASCFLLPESEFKKQVFTASLLELKSLKGIWRVSIAAMIMRLQGLGILDQDETRRMWANYNRRGWKTEEPFDREWAPEEPRLIKDAIELLVDSGGYSVRQVVERLFPDSSFLAKSSSLPLEFFNPSPQISLKPVNIRFG